MNQLTNTLRLLPAFPVMLILTSCVGFKAKPDPSRYYVLGGDMTTTTTVPIDCKKTVLVGPVTLAGHLDNPKIALRRGENEIDYLAWRFWAAPLARALPRALMSSLEKAIPDRCVFSYREASATDNSVQLDLLIEQFEMTDSGNVIVAASWSITSNGEKQRPRGRTRIVQPYEMGNDEVVAGVQALTVALDALSKKIAEELR